MFAKTNSMRKYQFFVYITTNPNKTNLYIGMTNNLGRRLQEHFENRGNSSSYTGRYYCYNLIYFEEYQYVNDAIAREKQLKKWSRKKKEWLINQQNPEWLFLNKQFPFKEEYSSTSSPE